MVGGESFARPKIKTKKRKEKLESFIAIQIKGPRVGRLQKVSIIAKDDDLSSLADVGLLKAVHAVVGLTGSGRDVSFWAGFWGVA